MYIYFQYGQFKVNGECQLYFTWSYLSQHITHQRHKWSAFFLKSLFNQASWSFRLPTTFTYLFLLYSCIPPYWSHRILNHSTKSQMYRIQVSKHAPLFTISQYTFSHTNMNMYTYIYIIICIQWHSSVSFLCEKFFVCETTFVAFFAVHHFNHSHSYVPRGSDADSLPITDLTFKHAQIYVCYVHNVHSVHTHHVWICCRIVLQDEIPNYTLKTDWEHWERRWWRVRRTMMMMLLINLKAHMKLLTSLKLCRLI